MVTLLRAGIGNPGTTVQSAAGFDNVDGQTATVNGAPSDRRDGSQLFFGIDSSQALYWKGDLAEIRVLDQRESRPPYAMLP